MRTCWTGCKSVLIAHRRRREFVDGRLSTPLRHPQSVDGATHFLTKTIPRVSTEMSLHVLAYNLKRAMQIVGIAPLVKAITV